MYTFETMTGYYSKIGIVALHKDKEYVLMEEPIIHDEDRTHDDWEVFITAKAIGMDGKEYKLYFKVYCNLANSDYDWDPTEIIEIQEL